MGCACPEKLEKKELIELVAEKIQELPDQQKKVLALSYYEEMRLSEIARITRTGDSSNDAVYWRIRLRSGEEHVIQIREPGDPPYRFTGKKSSGETLALPAQDINRIVFR